VLIGRTAMSVDFSPQGLLENVFIPFVVHSQICPLCAGGSALSCDCALIKGAGSGSATDAVTGSRAVAGVAVAAVAIVVEVAGASRGGDTGVDVTCLVAALAGGKLVGTVLLGEAIVMTAATAATENPPKIQTSKWFLFFMDRLSSAAQTSATYLKQN